MKKFTKIMLITAGVLSLIGIVLCAGGVLLGGSIKAFWNNSFVEEFSFLDETFVEENESKVTLSGEYFEIEDEDTAIAEVFKEEGGEEIFRGRIENLQDLSLTMGGGIVTVIASERNDVRICVNSQYLDVVVVHDDEEELEVEVMQKKVKLLEDTPILTVQVPEQFIWNELDIELMAGQLVAEELYASEISVTVQAGKVDIESMGATEVDLEVQAGAVKVGYLDAVNADISCDAGAIDINDGAVDKEADITCNAGAIKAKFYGNPDDYSYELQASLGRISLNGEEYSGISGTKIKGNGTGKFDVSCNVGAIELTVEESADMGTYKF